MTLCLEKGSKVKKKILVEKSEKPTFMVGCYYYVVSIYYWQT